MQHSIRIYENDRSLSYSSIIMNIVEQNIKVMIANQPVMFNTIALILSETLFHPQGGGQPSDQGTINGVSVLTVREDKGVINLHPQAPLTIYHYFDIKKVNKHYFKIGQKVDLQVDETFRQKCQRSHSAGHLIADVIELESDFREYAPKVIHGNHFPRSEYIKVLLKNQPKDLDEFCEKLNHIFNKLIDDNLPVVIFPKNNNHPRHIKIGESKRMCGGTHITSTKYLKKCKITKVKCAKNKEGYYEATIFYY